MNDKEFSDEFTKYFTRICIDRLIDNAQDKGKVWISMIKEGNYSKHEVLRAIKTLSLSDKRFLVFGDLLKQIEEEKRMEI